MPRVPFDPATDYYQLLGVSAGASSEQIQAAYRRLAKAYHPDLNAGSATAAARMARVNVAKSVLLDPQTRAQYDGIRAARATARAASASRVAHSPSYRSGVTTTGVRVQYVTTSYRPPAGGSQPAYRTSTLRVGKRTGGSLDRQTGVLLLLVVPLLAALVVYVVQAVQVSSQPLRPSPADLALVPNGRPTAHGTADAVFLMVHTQPPSRQLARQAMNLISSRTDNSPDAELLRADGRRLYNAAATGDAATWDATVADLCRLAGRCAPLPTQ
jgi:hypothetical protein